MMLVEDLMLIVVQSVMGLSPAVMYAMRRLLIVNTFRR